MLITNRKILYFESICCFVVSLTLTISFPLWSCPAPWLAEIWSEEEEEEEDGPEVLASPQMSRHCGLLHSKTPARTSSLPVTPPGRIWTYPHPSTPAPDPRTDTTQLPFGRPAVMFDTQYSLLPHVEFTSGYSKELAMPLWTSYTLQVHTQTWKHAHTEVGKEEEETVRRNKEKQRLLSAWEVTSWTDLNHTVQRMARSATL